MTKAKVVEPFTITTLLHRPELVEDALSLIEKSFHYTDKYSYKIDFLPLVHKSNLHNCQILIKDDKLIGHIGFLPKKMIFKEKSYPIIFLGGIALDEEYRGRGLFKVFFQNVLEKYHSKFGLFFLWSDLFDMYEKFDFHLSFGQMESLGIWQNIEEEAYRLGFRKHSLKKLDEKNKDILKGIYHKHSDHLFTIDRDEKDWELIESITSTDLFIKKDPEGDLRDYFFLGKGQDLDGIIHEVGSVDNESDLIKTLENAKVWHHETSNVPDNWTLKYMGLTRIGNPDIFKEIVSTFSEGQIEIIGVTDEQVAAHFNRKVYYFKPKEFLQYLFGPEPAKEFKDFWKPLYIPGLDSV
ncbi:MAG: GNAT family N-acetyltransferase [Bacteriovoracaceae bacterium]|jgi:hypothetical protein|nr:GNAT family N-acetyltransferase [Bacteriovoracaceae bacterium]